MRQVTLTEFAAEHGHTKAALLLGVTQGAVSKALRVRREVVVICHADGTYTAQETRPFPSQPNPKAA